MENTTAELVRKADRTDGGALADHPSVPGNVTDYLLGGKSASRAALILLDGEHGYGELQDASYDIAQHLVRAGGRKGDRVPLISENSFFWAACYLGTLRAGMVCIPLPVQMAAEDIAHILQITDARFAFLQTGFAAKHACRLSQISVVVDRELPGASAVSTVGFAKLRSELAGADTELPVIYPNDLAALMFTSGSTGRPRGVMISHANIMANTDSIIDYLGLTQYDRIMTVLPFHYCFGTSLLHTHLRVGGSLVLDSRFMYPQTVLQRMQETRCSGFAGVPSHYQILLRRSGLAKMSFPDLRYVQQAGGHLAPNFVRELREALPRVKIFVMYGQTEATARLSYLPPEHLEKKPGSIGKGIPGVALKVLDEFGKQVGPGTVGEVVAHGANIAWGYWRDPVSSARTFQSGSLHTGDLATVDEEGFIFVVDRATDFLKCGGKRVSCRQIEERLLEYEGLVEAAVVGIPDDVLGEAVKAFVVPHVAGSNGFEERFRLYCKSHMPAQWVPREIVVLQTLPKNSAGKILKQALKKPVGPAPAILASAQK